MRIIAGTARGTRLASFEGSATRPTADRVREALFSILLSRFGSLAGFRVLDLFAGSGALALEALSRGAASAILVEQAPGALRTIKANVAVCRCTERVQLMPGDALRLLPQLRRLGPFELIFLDPPYHSGLALPALQGIAHYKLARDAGLVVMECDRQEDITPPPGLRRVDCRNYGRSTIHFFQPEPSSHEAS